MTRSRVGAQRPTHLVTPDGDFDFSDGDIACELAARLGLELLDWQRWLVRWILATDADGRPACNTVVVVVPRQNGKSAILEAVELFWLIVAGVKITIHTAHEADTAAGHMERIEAMTAEPSIELPAIKTYKSNGKERTRNLDEKLLLQYRTRTKATKRGASPQRVVMDECQELEDAHLAALVPALAAQSMNDEVRPQLIYTGSAPLEHSLYMHRLIKQVTEKRPARTLLAMWACEADDDPADVENWYRSNPSLGILISEEWVRDTEYVVLSPEDFAAERLGVAKVAAGTAGGPIDVDRWAALVDGESLPEGDTVRLALDVPPDLLSASFAVAGKRADGLTHGSLRYQVTSDEMPRLIELAKSLTAGHGVPLIVPRGPVEAWLPGLRAAGVPLDEMSSRDYAAACSMMQSTVTDGAFRHRGQPEMNAAVAGLSVRRKDDLDVWARRSSSANIAPFVALTCAIGRLSVEPTVEKPRAKAWAAVLD